jgi:hypothetical protein
MPIQTAQQKENLAVAYGTNATYGAIYTSAPGASAGTEPSGGSPAYARKALTWAPGTVDGVVTATATFDVPSGATIVGAGVHTAVTGGTYLDGGAVTSQAFATQGTYTVTYTYTQS